MTARPATLHARLIAKQSTAELRRKRDKARRRGYMTTTEERDMFARSGAAWLLDALIEDLANSPAAEFGDTLDVSLHTGAER